MPRCLRCGDELMNLAEDYCDECEEAMFQLNRNHGPICEYCGRKTEGLKDAFAKGHMIEVCPACYSELIRNGQLDFSDILP